MNYTPSTKKKERRYNVVVEIHIDSRYVRSESRYIFLLLSGQRHRVKTMANTMLHQTIKVRVRGAPSQAEVIQRRGKKPRPPHTKRE